MWVLSKVAFPKIQEALDKRAKTIAESIDAAETPAQGVRRAAGRSTASRLAEAREQADDIMARARKAAETAEAEATAAGTREARGAGRRSAKRDIEAETRRSLEQIRKEVADLTVLATEKVTRKTLTADDQKRLVEEALAEVDFSSLSGVGELRLAMQEVARVYAEALFEVAKEKGKLDAIREQLGQFADARRRRPRAAGLLLQPLLLLGREARGPGAGGRAAPSPSWSTSSSCWSRSTGCRRSSASAASSTSSGRRRTAAST